MLKFVIRMELKRFINSIAYKADEERKHINGWDEDELWRARGLPLKDALDVRVPALRILTA